MQPHSFLSTAVQPEGFLAPRVLSVPGAWPKRTYESAAAQAKAQASPDERSCLLSTIHTHGGRTAAAAREECWELISAESCHAHPLQTMV